jgi:hypothetical protein
MNGKKKNSLDFSVKNATYNLGQNLEKRILRNNNSSSSVYNNTIFFSKSVFVTTEKVGFH